MTHVRPAARFPVIDEAGLPRQAFETLRLAQRRELWKPQPPDLRSDQVLQVDATFGKFQNAIHRADMGVDEVQLTAQYGKPFRFDPVRGKAQELHRILYR